MALTAALAGPALWGAQQGTKNTSTNTSTSTSASARREGAKTSATDTSATSATPATPPPPAEPIINVEQARKDSLAVLSNSLSRVEPEVRVDGVRAVTRVKDGSSVPKLTELTEKDLDKQVRASAAEGLGKLGASAAARLLAELEQTAAPPLQVHYTAALARLGDKAAVGRLHKQVKHKDLAIAFPAAMALAELSKPGDKKTLRALRALTEHEAELNAQVPYAGAVLLTKLAALRDDQAHEVLVSLLSSTDEGTQLAAAEGLVKLGDDRGKQVLAAVVANPASPNRLVAAVAQIPLGEYGGLELINQALAGKDLGQRILAARALGDIAQKSSLTALLPLITDGDWRMRVAAAAAAVTIAALIDPGQLAQASVNWTKGAMDSEDWAVRQAAAGVLADLPAADAVPLLARAIADKEKGVRLRASRSARKMKTAEAAREVVAAIQTEADPEVKEEQIIALGEIGHSDARATLAALSEEPGRLGVMAAGSLISVGDPSGALKLEAAVAAPATGMRLAAVQAASRAQKPIVLPTLKLGAGDRVFDVQLTAAEGLSLLNLEKALALPILTSAMKAKDTATVSRALTALTRFGEAPDDARTPAQMLESADPAQRLAAVPVVQEMPMAERLPLLRRLLADPDQQVRRAGVDAVESVVKKAPEEAIKLYKPLVTDADPVVRSKASGQMSRLVVEPPKTAATPAPAPEPVPAAAPAPAPDDALPKVLESLAQIFACLLYTSDAADE